MSWGLEEETIRRIKEVFSSFSSIEKVVLYGSRAKGNYREGSDIDFCLYGKNIDLHLLHRISESLEDLFLPYTFDLCGYELLENQDLKSHIHRVGVLFFSKN